MTTTLRYLINPSVHSVHREVLDFRTAGARYRLDGVDHDYTLNNEQIAVSGNSLPNTVWATPGVTLDVTRLLGGVDTVLFGGAWAEYTKTLNAVEASITFTREVNGQIESVTVNHGQLSLYQERLVFADGNVRTDTVRKALINHGPSVTLEQLAAEGAKTPDTADDWDPSVTSLNPETLLPAQPRGIIRGTAKAQGVNFALPTPGDEHLLAGSAGVDQVYITPGATVNARQLLGGEDRIFFTGAWSDYDKVLDPLGGIILFTRDVNGQLEHVTVANGQVSLNRDLLVFADGAIRSDTVRLTLVNKGLTASVDDLKAQGALTIDTRDDWRGDTATLRTQPPTIDPVSGDDWINSQETRSPVRVTGSAEAGSTVALTWGGVQKSVTTDASGKWSASFVASEIPGDGDYTITAISTDKAGNVSAPSTRQVSVDTVAPSFPTIDPLAGDQWINAAEKAAGVTVTGTAEAGSTVRVEWFIGSGFTQMTQTVTADSQGKWAANFAASEFPQDSEGFGSVHATATDKAGNFSYTTPVVIAVDTVAPASPTLDPITGDNVISPSERKAGVTVTGTTEAGAKVYLNWFVPFGQVQTKEAVTADASGRWSVKFDDGELPSQGSVNFSATVFDEAGNQSAADGWTASIEPDSTPASDPTAHMVISA